MWLQIFDAFKLVVRCHMIRILFVLQPQLVWWFIACSLPQTKLNFLKAYKKPIPSIHNTILQELIVQQHLMRYKRSYWYDPVFALSFVTVHDQLMDGYASDED